MAQLTLTQLAGLDPPLATSDSTPRVVSLRLEQLIDQHLDFVWRSLRRLGVPHSAVDDATQRVWLVLTRKLAELVIGQERAFLFGTAVRVASDVRRGLARHREVNGLDIDAVDPSPGPHELMDRRQARGVLDEILDTLPTDLRAVFILYELEEQTAAQIAELLALPMGTVASRLRRARSEFRESVKRHQARTQFMGGR